MTAIRWKNAEIPMSSFFIFKASFLGPGLLGSPMPMRRALRLPTLGTEEHISVWEGFSEKAKNTYKIFICQAASPVLIPTKPVVIPVRT